jgi:hypothetical protein
MNFSVGSLEFKPVSEFSGLLAQPVAATLRNSSKADEVSLSEIDPPAVFDVQRLTGVWRCEKLPAASYKMAYLVFSLPCRDYDQNLLKMTGLMAERKRAPLKN